MMPACPFLRGGLPRLHSPVQYVPGLLVALRTVLGPLVCLCTIRGLASGWIVAGLLAAFLSDLFDGLLARRLGVASERLRVADSWADGFYYLWIGLSVWWTRPSVLYDYRFPLMLVVSLQLCSYGLDLLKYRRIASFHAYSAKAWGISLFVAGVALLGFRTGGIVLWPAIILGILSNIEGIAMKWVLPTWTCDVPSLAHALRMRRHDGTPVRAPDAP